MYQSLDDDISEDDRTLLSARDRQLRTVFEMALDAIAIADDEGRYLDVNPAACELFGLEKDELLGCCISDFTEPSLTKETGFFLRKDALQPADSVKNPVSGTCEPSYPHRGSSPKANCQPHPRRYLSVSDAS